MKSFVIGLVTIVYICILMFCCKFVRLCTKDDRQ